MVNGEQLSTRGRGSVKTYFWYSIQYWIYPFTGWNTPFKYVNSINFFKLSDEYEKLEE